MAPFNGLNKGDIRLIIGCIICMLICGYLMEHVEDIFRRRNSSGPRIGTLTVLENDTRYRSNDSLTWSKAQEREEIGIGDAIFSGDKSYAVVEMKKGGMLTIGESSMVVFREIRDQRLADLQLGNFRLKIDGSVKIAIQGEVTTLEGENSEVQIFMGKNKKPRLRLIKGKTEVKSGRARSFVIEDVREIVGLAVEKPRTPPPEVPPSLQPQDHPAEQVSVVTPARPLASHAQKSPPSRGVAVPAREKPKPSVAKAVEKKKEAKRKPASVEAKNSAKIDEAPPSHLNERYRDSLLSLVGFLWTLQSTQQALHSESAPVAAGAGVRSLYWWNHSGMEGVLKTQAFAVNGAGKQTSVKDFEARYHYRFLLPFPLRYCKELQISLFGGYDVYGNTGAMFSSRYNLMTFGTSLEFPVANRWSMGGEFVYGYGFDSSLKYEITGHFRYYVSKSWSFGFGYLLHLFQAGATGAAPSGILPYREAFTEGISTLDYHF